MDHTLNSGLNILETEKSDLHYVQDTRHREKYTLKDFQESEQIFEKQMSNMMHNEVNIERLQKDVSKLQSDVEKLKDKQRQFANGNGNH